MLIHLAPAVLSAALLLPIADRPPQFNVQPNCRASAELGVGLDSTESSCMDDERSAQAELQKAWPTFASDIRSSCLTVSTAGGMPSYVELLECMIIERDARQFENTNQATNPPATPAPK